MLREQDALDNTVIVMFYIKDPRQRDLAASGAGLRREIGDWPIDKGNILFGHLWIDDMAGNIRFLFRFETYAARPPCGLTVKCKTWGDGKAYPAIPLNRIYLNNSAKGELVIASDIIPGFDCSDVEIQAVEELSLE
jgi:hypothetical protein